MAGAGRVRSPSNSASLWRTCLASLLRRLAALATIIAMQLRGQVAIVTGASRGIGAAIAEKLGSQGATVALAARSAEGLSATAERVRAAGGIAATVPTDVTAPSALETLVARVNDEFGAIDILINNAGIESIGPFAELDIEEITALLMTNVGGLQILTRLVLPEMVDRRRGKIINIASVAGWGGTPLAATYVASKHAVLGFSFSLRAEVRPYGVTVSALSPTWVADDGFMAGWGIRRKPPWFMGTATSHEVADATMSLLSSGRAEKKVAPMRMYTAGVLTALAPDFMSWFVTRIGLPSYLEAVASRPRD